jgi:hypothetical protein
VPLADGDLVNPDDLGSRGAHTAKLFPHVLLIEFLDRLPVQPLLFHLATDRAIDASDLQLQGDPGAP